MAPTKHALLGASSAARWIACPPSARLCEAMPDTGSTYASEGTAAHAACEAALRHCIPQWEQGQTPDYPLPDDPEMAKAVSLYVDFIHEQWLGYPIGSGIFIEQPVVVTKWVAGGFGTCDCLMVGGGAVHVVDFKYGQGIPVSPEHNPQLMYYALGAYDMFEGLEEFTAARMSIVQPRIQTEPERWEISITELLDWAEHTLRPAAELAWKGEGTMTPGEHCKKHFCKLYPTCRAWKDEYGELAGFDPLPPPPALSGKELGEWLDRVQGLAQYAHDLEENARNQLEAGEEIPGWKLVAGRNTRKWTDQAAAFHQMKADGIEDALLYNRTPITLTEAEKLLGKKRFAESMASYITKAPGAPKLAKASDKRPAYISNTLDGFEKE